MKNVSVTHQTAESESRHVNRFRSCLLATLVVAGCANLNGQNAVPPETNIPPSNTTETQTIGVTPENADSIFIQHDQLAARLEAAIRTLPAEMEPPVIAVVPLDAGLSNAALYTQTALSDLGFQTTLTKSGVSAVIKVQSEYQHPLYELRPTTEMTPADLLVLLDRFENELIFVGVTPVRKISQPNRVFNPGNLIPHSPSFVSFPDWMIATKPLEKQVKKQPLSPPRIEKRYLSCLDGVTRREDAEFFVRVMNQVTGLKNVRLDSNAAGNGEVCVTFTSTRDKSAINREVKPILERLRSEQLSLYDTRLANSIKPDLMKGPLFFRIDLDRMMLNPSDPDYTR